MKITKTSLLFAGMIILMGTVDASYKPVTYAPAVKPTVTASAAAPAATGKSWWNPFTWGKK